VSITASSRCRRSRSWTRGPAFRSTIAARSKRSAAALWGRKAVEMAPSAAASSRVVGDTVPQDQENIAIVRPSLGRELIRPDAAVQCGQADGDSSTGEAGLAGGRTRYRFAARQREQFPPQSCDLADRNCQSKKPGLLPSGGRFACPEHDDFRADWRAVVEIDAEASGKIDLACRPL
jgi:hypothetical protein